MFTSLTIAISALKRNKTRTALTVLGIIIGIASVITVMTAGEGLKQFVVGQVSAFGTDYIEVEIKIPAAGKNSTANAGALAQGITITTLTLDDAGALRKISNIKNNYSGTMGQQLVAYQGENKQASLFGTSPSFIDIDTGTVQDGRFYSQDEDNGLASVVVLGDGVKKDLFGDQPAVNELIRIGQQKFRVIGVMAPKGSAGFLNMDDFIFMPIQTLQKKVMGIDHITFIFNQVYDTTRSEETADEIRSVLRTRHDITDPDKEDFSVTTMAEALDTLDTIFGAISLLLLAVAGISLVVGGVGIMNIMYVSVAERTYEIGLRKAVGATRQTILLQFLWEAIIVTLFGAFIGIILGLSQAWLISVGAQLAGFNLPFVFVPGAIVMACGVAISIGLFFGIFPARQAARLDPVTALRANR